GGRQPEPFGRPRLRLDDAPRSRLQDPHHHEAEAQRGESGPHEIESYRALFGLLLHPPREEEDSRHHDDLAREDVTPGEVRGAEAADYRSGSDRDRGGGRDEPVGTRALALP